MSSSTRKPPRTSGGRGGRGRGRPTRRGRGGRSGPSPQDTFSDEDVLIAFMPYMRNGDEEAARIHERYGHDQRAFVQQVRHFLENKRSQASKVESAPHPAEDAAPLSPASAPQRPAASTPISMSPQPGKTPFTTPISSTPPKSEILMGDLTDRMDQLLSEDDPVFFENRSPPGMSAIAKHNPTPPPPPPFAPTSPSSLMPPIGSKASGALTTPPRPVAPSTLSPALAHSSPPGIVAPPSGPSMPSLSPGKVTPHMTPPGSSSIPPTFQNHGGNWSPLPQGLKDSTPPPAETTPKSSPKQEPPKPPPPKKEYQPKRVWTRLEEQPGRLLANNVPGSSQKTFRLRPRQELTAKWMLPLAYLRKRNTGKDISLKQALRTLAVGLYRQGCTENSESASIISKEILSPPGETRKDYPFEIDSRADTVWGTVPFYSPRTPGHVVLRLYWQDEPLYTLATGPALYVCVSSNADVEPTLRFILSNFKSKSKSNSTSLSSLHSLAAVLDQFHPPPESHQGNNNAMYRRWDGAGRAAWGCICESKKVLEYCAVDYLKAKEKHVKLEEEVNELQAKVDEESDSQNDQEPELLGDEDEEDSSSLADLKDKLKGKMGILMGGRASTERRWKDAQQAFASILKAVVTNQASFLLFKRDLISEIRLEYELWCPLCEAFAPNPFCASDESSSSTKDSLCINRNLLPRPITGDHFQTCAESRIKMQLDSLGFQPNAKRLEEVLMPTRNANKRSPNHKKSPMDRKAVGAFNVLSSAMCQLYQDVYLTSDLVHQQRELVRSQTESIVAQCGAFPPGTKVVVFGSAANGFGSPASDLDMCLQLPADTSIKNEDDKTGAGAMAQLAELFEKAGLKNVDAGRLTARIPVVKFDFPRPLPSVQDGDESLVECDLSMQNPLACLNTSLLLSYSRINPMTNVLASIIKRWAKNRDINNPARHTLSSYGYILMLLHFLTFHKSTNEGLVTTLSKEGDERGAKPPLLPNLLWMDATWPDSPPGTPYREMAARPRILMPHPSEENNFVVNTYFYRLSDQPTLSKLQRRFPGQDSSVAVLLASFFRYYAFEFDFKKHVVSLHSTASQGLVEREVKAEIDCWKVYFQGLAIEDPFETFYDVAHVVKGSNFHRLRQEFALAYTKIADAASGSQGSWNDRDLSSMTGRDLLDWICEPILTEQEE